MAATRPLRALQVVQITSAVYTKADLMKVGCARFLLSLLYGQARPYNN